MELLNYFDFHKVADFYKSTDSSNLGKSVRFNSQKHPLTNIDNYDLAIIGIVDERNSPNKGSSGAANEIRRKLYKLNSNSKQLKIIDLGNLKNGKKVDDTYFALRYVVSQLLSHKIVPVVIGAGNDMNYPLFLALEDLKKNINIVNIDSRLGVSQKNEKFDANNAFAHILAKHQSTLLNFTNIGCQSYFTNETEILLLDEQLHDVLRLGVAQEDISITEPLLRDADIVSLNIGAVKQSDAPAHFDPSPNGFFSNEACQLSWYAGMSDKVSAFGIFDVNPLFDNNNQTSHLAAQIIWYFIEGFYNRKQEYPVTNIQNHKKYIVYLDEIKRELIFFQSQITMRWWIEVPCKNIGKLKNIYIACTENDYKKASHQEIPDRWWRYFSKLNL